MINNNHRITSLIIIILITIQLSNSFIIQGRKGLRKCFSAQHSPDKTLEVRFSFPRRQKQNCAVHFTVDIIQQNKFKNNIYSDIHKCHQMAIGQPAVVKHTSQSYSMEGQYKVCFSVMEDKNEDLLMELFIGEKLNPMMYSDGEDVLPLIQAQQLINLDLSVQTIRKSLGWSRKLLEETTQLGDLTEANVDALEQFTLTATIVQIVFLLAYAGFWVYIIKSQKNH